MISLAHFAERLTIPPVPQTKEELQNAVKGFRRDLKLSELPFKCWELSTGKNKPGIIEACMMAENGSLVIGVGSKEQIWIWHAN